MADRLLRIRAVLDKTGSNTTDIYAGMKAGTFPKSVPIGKRTVGWVEREIDEWIASRIDARDGGKLLPRAPGPGRGHKGSAVAGARAA